MRGRALVVTVCLAAGACAPGPASPPSAPESPSAEGPKPEPKTESPPPSALRELFPHVRVDDAAGVVEIDGIVPIDVHDPQTPDVYLEVTVCTRDSKEHESLVMTDARPSHVHAALLLLGLKPGKPGSVVFDGQSLGRIAPTGDWLTVSIAYTDAEGKQVESPAAAWVLIAGTKNHFKASSDGPYWVFSGSRFVTRNGKDWYDADGAGTLIGLTTFGGETVAWAEVYSPESSVDQPEWVADAAMVPAFGTPVVVRIRPAQ